MRWMVEVALTVSQELLGSTFSVMCSTETLPHGEADMAILRKAQAVGLPT